MNKNSVEGFTHFIETPRNKLFNNKNTHHIGAFDLGEIRGHHWSNMVQALRPPSSKKNNHAVWSFPRKAYMRALLQTMAFYNLVLHL